MNARIYTVNAKQPWAEALAIRDGKVLAVGTANEIAAYRGPSTKVSTRRERWSSRDSPIAIFTS